MTIYPSLLDRLKSQHLAINEIIKTVGTVRLTTRPQPGKWNIHDNIAHLAKYQPFFAARISDILVNNEKMYERYQAENDPEFETWRSWSTFDLLQRLYTDRTMIFKMITGLNEEQLKRVGVHKKFGRLTIPGWTEFFLLHEAHHIFTIFRLANDTEL